jgi:hypothetical protein
MKDYFHCSIKWGPGSGTFRTTTENDADRTKNSLFVHSDGVTDFVSLLYLNKPEDCHGGTAFYRHIPSGLDGFHDLKKVSLYLEKANISLKELVSIVETDARDSSKWMQVDMIRMKYNRLIAYNGRIFHSHVFDFNKVNKNAKRLTFVCFGTRSTATRSP